MTQIDSRGLPLSTSSGQAAALYREGIDLMLSAWPTAAETLERAIAADPDFALPLAARARIAAMWMDMTAARTLIGRAEETASRWGTERERSHVHTLSLAIQGRSADALEAALTHIETWPRDVVVFSLPLGAFGLLAFSGRADHDQARVDLCERHARHFSADDWWFLTYLGWSHAENGNAIQGRGIVERGFGLRRANANAAHALSHAMYESGAAVEAEALIGDWLPGYSRSGVLHAHIAWHAALGALERNDAERALAHYAEFIQPSVTKGVPLNVVSDTGSFLWRLKAYGHGIPPGLWKDAADYARDRFQKPGFSFADIHMALLDAETGKAGAVRARAAGLDELVSAGTLAAGPVVPAVCRAFEAFAEGRYAAAAGLLEPLAHDAVRIGGSGAQREMIEDMLLLSLMRSGATEKAVALLDRRLHKRPSLRDRRWQAELVGAAS